MRGCLAEPSVEIRLFEGIKGGGEGWKVDATVMGLGCGHREAGLGGPRRMDLVVYDGRR